MLSAILLKLQAEREAEKTAKAAGTTSEGAGVREQAAG
jgi:hypothetical protein